MIYQLNNYNSDEENELTFQILTTNTDWVKPVFKVNIGASASKNNLNVALI